MEDPLRFEAAVHADLYGTANASELALLHANIPEWKNELVRRYTEICGQFTKQRAKSLKIGNVVARSTFEQWRADAQVRKQKIETKLRSVKILLRGQDSGNQHTEIFKNILDELTEIKYLMAARVHMDDSDE